METKICSKCREVKNICEFGKDKTRKGGYSYLCKSCLIEKSFIYKKNNREKVLNGYKDYHKKNGEKIKESRKEYVKNNQDKISEYKKKYYSDNKEYFLNWEREKRKSDPLFKLSGNMRKRINSFVKLNKFAKKTKTFDLIGCDPISLKDFLEKKFIEGMCWGNYGEWHIDHIMPLSSAKTEEEVYKLCHYTNLQPLWAIDNLKKGNKVLPNLHTIT